MAASSTTARKLTSSIIAALPMLAGCTSISANQRPITVADVDSSKFVCPTAGQLAAAAANPAAARNSMIMVCVKAIDSNYLAFKVALHREGVGSNLVVDILSLGLSTGASLAGEKAAQRLSAGSAFVLGSGAAINKDIFYQQTLPALEASMDAQRDRILKQILDSEAKDPEAKAYTMVDAGFDLARYEQAGNLYAAIAELTKTAAAAAEKAQADRAAAATRNADFGLYVPLTADVQSRFRAAEASLDGLQDPADRSKLNALAATLGLKIDPGTDFETERQAVFTELYRTTHVTDASAATQQLDKVEPLLK